MDSTVVECWLPYAGLDDVPHPKTPNEVRLGSKIELKSQVWDYVTAIQPVDEYAIIITSLSRKNKNAENFRRWRRSKENYRKFSVKVRIVNRKPNKIKYS